jgi:N6-adenosine-specific RNA methylase IME4
MPTMPPKYKTIYADPPWPHQQRGARGASQHYSLMSLDQIKNMPVAELTAEDAHLWLWTTNAALEDAFDVARAWGFVPRSLLTWVKWPKLGLGVYLRNATEQVVFATRGKAPVRFRSQPSWFTAPTQEHSVKPEEIFSIIERVSEGPFLELFARRRPSSNRDWSVWGNEVACDLRIPGYPVPRYSSRAAGVAAAPESGLSPTRDAA